MSLSEDLQRILARNTARASKSPQFNGADYVSERDDTRLTNQLGRIWHVVMDGQWRTLREIADKTGDPEPSISAQLRHLRKERFGGHTVEREHIDNGLYRYRVLVNSNKEAVA